MDGSGYNIMTDIKLLKESIFRHNPKKIFQESVDLKADVIPEKAKAAAIMIEDKLKKMFDDRFVIQVRYGENLGRSLRVLMYDNAPENGIAANSSVYTSISTYLSSNFGKDIDLSSVSFERSQGPRSIKFRKITSKKSIDDAAKKLLKYFEKNKAAYTELLDSGKKPWEK